MATYTYSIGPWTWQEGWTGPPGFVSGIDLRPLASQGLAGTLGSRPFGLFVTTIAPTSLDYTILGEGDIRQLPSTLAARDAWESHTGFRPDGALLVDLLWEQLTAGASVDGSTGPRPLMPTISGELQLALGGHSIIKRERFDWLTHPHKAKVLAVLQDDLRNARIFARAGNARRPIVENGKVVGVEADVNWHRRYIQALLEKYKGAGFDELRPVGWPANEAPLPHDTTITDNFNRTDADPLGSSSEGWLWTEVTGDADIVTNEVAHPTGSSNCRAESDLASSDHYSQITLTNTPASTRQFGPTTRYASAADTCYMFRSMNTTTATHRLFKRVTGTNTELTNVNDTATPSGAVLKCEISGSTLTGYHDGVSEITTSDTSITGNTRTGFSSNNSGVNMDNFSAADLAVAAALTSRLLLLLGAGT